jgi:hypothetical protein
MNAIRVKVKDEVQFGIVIDLMLKSGRPFGPGCTKAISGEDYANKVYDTYPLPLLDTNNVVTATYSTNYTHSWPEDATRLIKDLFSKTYEVENVGDYKATITDKGIVVGCQTIPFDKFQEIVNKVTEFKADQ